MATGVEVSSSEDSEMLSSSSSEASSSYSSSASEAASPRSGSGGRDGAGCGSGGDMLHRAVPSLSLRVNLAALPRGDDAPPETARQAGPAMRAPLPQLRLGQLANPAAAAAAEGAPLASARGPRPPLLPSTPLPVQQQLPACQAALLSLDMLSPAFSLDQQQQVQLRPSCASRLGVAPERLKFYALTEVAGLEQLPPGCSRVAVEVLDSRFSLSALEDLLAENQQLAAGQQGIDMAAQVQQLQAQLHSLQAEKEALRQRLKKSESLRNKGHQQLLELKQEFDALHREVLLSPAVAALEFGQKQQQCKEDRVKPVGTPAAVADALL